MTTDAVESDDDGRVRALTLNRPDRLNAVTPSSYRLLTSELVAAASDDAVAVVLVAEHARLRAPFTRLGTAPEAGSSWLLPMVVGPQRAAELLLSSRWLEADEAVD